MGESASAIKISRGIEVIGKIVRKVYLLLLPLMLITKCEFPDTFVLRKQRVVTRGVADVAGRGGLDMPYGFIIRPKGATDFWSRELHLK